MSYIARKSADTKLYAHDTGFDENDIGKKAGEA